MKFCFSFHKKWFGWKLAVAAFCVSCAVFLSLSIGSYIKVAQMASALAEPTHKTIILDAGHGGEDGGTSSKAGLLEKDINLAIALKLESMLTASGFDVIMIREDDISINDPNLDTVKERKVSDLKNRLKIMGDHPDAIFVSIHQNHFEQDKYYGSQVFYSKNIEQGQILASYIQSNIVSLLQNSNTRECKGADKSIYLLWNAKIPAVIVECGFLSNESEAQKLGETTYQKQMAFSIYCGILNYYNN